MGRPDIGAATAARLTDEARFDVGEPDIVGPLVGADLDRVAATVVEAIDQHMRYAGLAHLAEGDFWGLGGGTASISDRGSLVYLA